MSTDMAKPKEKEAIKIKKPQMFRVILFNDDFTPFNFVEQILMVIFNKTTEQSLAIAQKIHLEGSEVVGVYPLEIAETKQAQTIFNAQKNGYPLLCEIETEEDGE